MPVWQAAVEELIKEEKLVVVGVIQEQHAERCRLYAQWKKIEWPIVQDQMTFLGADKVPMAVLVDEWGIVREHMGFKRGTKLHPKTIKELVDQKFDEPTSPPAAQAHKSDFAARITEKQPLNPDSASDWIENGDNWMRAARFEDGLSSYTKALQLIENSNSAETAEVRAALQFRIGVAFRARFDSKDAKPDDFDQSVKYWTKALDAKPNQYIWRRRIEQYGPMQIKPYPFYDWVETAINEIKARGEEPIELNVALTQSEIADPRKTSTKVSSATNPDPTGKIERDKELVKISSVVVPAHIKPGKIARVHLNLVPANSKWNNESQPMVVWINGTHSTVTPLLEFPNPKEPESAEVRGLEFEIETSKDSTEHQVEGFALYTVCDSATGQCLYRRQDFSVTIPLKRNK